MLDSRPMKAKISLFFLSLFCFSGCNDRTPAPTSNSGQMVTKRVLVENSPESFEYEYTYFPISQLAKLGDGFILANDTQGVMKIGGDGEIKWMKKDSLLYESTNGRHVVEIQPTPDGSVILICNGYKDTSGPVIWYFARITRMDSSGDIQWTVNYDTADFYTEFYSLYVDPPSGTLYASGRNTDGGLLAKCDLQGSSIFENTSFGNDFQLYAICLIGNQLVALASVFNQDLESSELVMMTTDGIVQDRIALDLPTPGRFSITFNNGILVAGNGYTALVNLDGTISWKRFLETGQYCKGLYPLNDGQFLMLTDISSGGNDLAEVSKMNSRGDLLSAFSISVKHSMVINDLIVLDDRSMLLAGQLWDGEIDTLENQGILIKANLP